MQTKIIITGHGRFATGAQSTIDLIAGPQADILYWDFGIHWQSEDLENALTDYLAHNPGVPTLIFCDIIGGTPFRLAVEKTYGLANIAVVAGANISAMIEVILQNSMHSLSSLANLAVSETQGTVVRFRKKITQSQVVVTAQEGI